MSSVAIPLPKPAGIRPPFGGPPSRTTFDNSSGENRDPIHRVIADSVQQVLNACKTADAESAPLMLRLIEQRKRSVERELSVLRMLDPKPMPPLLTNMYVVDLVTDDSDVEAVYVRLLNDLDSVALRMLRLLDEQNGEAAAS